MTQEWYVISILAFGCLGSLIISILFSGEARTYGQLVAVFSAPVIGYTEWWKTKDPQVHFWTAAILGIMTLLAVFHSQVLSLVRKFTQTTTIL